MLQHFAKRLKRLTRSLTDTDHRAHKREVRAFKKAFGKETPVAFDGVTADSTVVDLGGYHGEWAAGMRAQHDCSVLVFEPHPGFARTLAERFESDHKVTVYDFALGARDGTFDLTDESDASSAFDSGGPTVTASKRSAADFLDTLEIRDFEVWKINIEGGEYEILPILIETGKIEHVNQLMVQFHKFTDEDVERRERIRAGLARTHECVWNFEFVWELWARRPV